MESATENVESTMHNAQGSIKEPSLKQITTVKNLVANGGNAAQALRDAGYSEAIARNPQKVTKSPTFVALLDEYLPERHLLDKHREFLDSKKKISTYVRGELKEVTEETDANAVKALDMAYKLKGKYQEKAGNNVLIINVSSQSSDRYKTPVHVDAKELQQDNTVQNTDSQDGQA